MCVLGFKYIRQKMSVIIKRAAGGSRKERGYVTWKEKMRGKNTHRVKKEMQYLLLQKIIVNLSQNAKQNVNALHTSRKKQ